jgi:molecular chaperone GrpE
MDKGAEDMTADIVALITQAEALIDIVYLVILALFRSRDRDISDDDLTIIAPLHMFILPHKYLKIFRYIKQFVKYFKKDGDPTVDKKKDGSVLPKSEPPIELPGQEKKPTLGAPEAKKLVEHEIQKLLGKEGAEVPEEASEQNRLETKVKELEDQLLRLQADFDNYRKRAARENDSMRENASADVLLKLLPAVDEFEIAMSHMDKASHKEFKQGMELIFSKMLDLLKREGVEPMKALGESFDPYKHDAIRQGVGEQGKIIEVVQKGYSYKGRVLRHAKVVVGKGKEQ